MSLLRVNPNGGSGQLPHAFLNCSAVHVRLYLTAAVQELAAAAAVPVPVVG